MKIAIIGAGFTGLSAAYNLSKKGHKVSVFEKEKNPGGLALGFREKEWDWSLEKHYHHWFTNDKFVLNLAKEINFEVITRRPKTSVFVNDHIYQFDSVLNILTFPLLNLFEKLRMGAVIAFLKINPYWKPLEKYRAIPVLSKFMGKRAYSLIWEALFINKFGYYASNISLSWFWARIAKRTPSLCYPKGGFLEFAKKLVIKIEDQKGVCYFNSSILNLSSKEKPTLTYTKSGGKIQKEIFDKIIVTVPSTIFLKISDELPKNYLTHLQSLKHLGATSLILRLKKPFFKENTYWLNVCDKNSPVMAIVEHTNFMESRYYNNEHILYLGNYKSSDDRYFSMTKEQLLKLFDSYLKKINPDYSNNIIDYVLFKDPFAQPVIPTNYSKLIPSFTTPLSNVYLANIEQVYPWDRGTNYAIELGQKIANIIVNDEA